MSRTDISIEEKIAAELAQELIDAAAPGKATEGIIVVLQRIKNDVAWTTALASTEAGSALQLAIRTCSTAPERNGDKALQALVVAVLDARSSQIRDAEVREVETRWWHVKPVPTEGSELITLEFRDVTPQHKSWPVQEVWPLESVECTSSELFENAAQRFRVQANKKHRHPFFPSVHFDAVLKEEQASFTALGTRTVAEILNGLAEEHVVQYIRNDEENRAEYEHSPARHFQVWERTLPEWCLTPDHWIEPIPPPGFVEGDVVHEPKEQYYKKVPTLHIPGTGRNIVPSAKKPEITTRSLFVPVEDLNATLTRLISLQKEDDLVPHGAHLIPGQINLEAARGLLGRVVQSSHEPRPDADEPRTKRRKVNKFAAQTVGMAWGLELGPDGAPAWLHCVTLGGTWHTDYVLDLTGQNRRHEEGSPIAVMHCPCAWVGAAVLPADKKVMQEIAAKGMVGKGTSPQASTSTSGGVLSFKEWYKKTTGWVRALNEKKFAQVVEVGPDGTFVGGDLELSKGEDDEFELEIAGAKPGVWLMSVISAPTDNEDGDGDDEMGDQSRTVRFIWTSDGIVNYDALPSQASIHASTRGDDAEWEVVGSFSVDSGVVCLFSKHALDVLLSTGTERQAMLESLIDEDDGSKVYVPGGVVVRGNDGGFEVEGRRNAESRLVELRLQL